jgi:hypothetical protein
MTGVPTEAWAAAIDPEIAESRALFDTIVHRLQVVMDLRDEVSVLKWTQICIRNLQYTGCDSDAIYRSPFFGQRRTTGGFWGDIEGSYCAEADRSSLPGCPCTLQDASRDAEK